MIYCKDKFSRIYSKLCKEMKVEDENVNKTLTRRKTMRMQ